MSEGLPGIVGYEIDARLGSGATGVVYQARQLSTGRTVAVKALAPELVGLPGWLERFRAEARLMTRFDDENLVNVYDYFESAGSAYLVMQYVAGVSLRDLLRSGERFGPEQALGVLAGSLSGLAAAHRLGVVHGDLKPENVIVTAQGVSKLIDFGQASPAGSLPSGGTPAYASPEALRDEVVDARSDVYAAGLLVYELLAGSPPFTGSPAEVAAAHRDAPVPVLKGVPAPVADLVARSLSKRPADRPPSAEAFLAELEDVATASYGADWRRRASIAALAGVLAGGSAGALASSSAERARRSLSHLRRARRIVSRGRAAASSHPIASAGVAAVVVAGSVVLAVQGSPLPIAGTFTAVSLTASATGVTCASGRCWVDLGSAILSLGPGKTRSLFQVPPAVGTISDISCPTPDFCVAGGSSPAGGGLALRSTNGGRTWTTATVPAAAGALASVSCAPRSMACWATAHNGLVSSVGGAAWQLQRAPPNVGGFGAISCATTSDCVAFAGSSPVWTRNGGLTWTGENGLAELYGSSGLDCVTAQVCWSVGAYQNSLQSQIGAVFRTTDGGAAWKVVSVPASPQPYAFDSIFCWSPSSCLLDGTVELGGLESARGTPFFLATVNGGAHWSVRLAPATMPYAPVISCTSSTECFLAGQSGVGTTSDDGATWQPTTYPTELSVAALACTNGGGCYLAGSFPQVTKGRLGAFMVLNSNPVGALVRLDGTEGGWSIGASDLAAVKLTALSCPAAGPVDECLAVAQSANNAESLVWLGIGGARAAVHLPATPQSVAGLSCPTTSVCWVGAGTSSGLVLWREKGGRWAAVRLPSGMQTLGQVSCVSTTTCLLAGTGPSGPVLLEVDVSSAATRWSLVSLPVGLQSLSAVECPTAAVCWITGTRTVTAPLGGSSSAAPQVVMYRTVDLASAVHPAPLSLATTTTTSASTTSTTVPHPTAWAPQPLPNGLASVTAVACQGVSSCFALGTLSSGAEVLLGAGATMSPLGGMLVPPTT